MANKALVIDVAARSALSGNLYKWDNIGNIESFTRDIITPALDRNADKSAIVSGIPTVFARPNLFALALGYSGDAMTDNNASLNGYYEELIEEWFGLITCIALDSGNLSVRRVTLAYSDGKTFAETGNLYEPKGSIGNMLFERAELWCEQTKENGVKHPFIDIIKYKGKVVGGTSPETLLFTAASYEIEPDTRFAPYGRFVNPLTNGNIKGADLLALYAYVKNLIAKVNVDLTNYYKDLREDIRPSYQHIAKKLETWKEQIRERIDDDVEKATANPVSIFSAPFDRLFNYSDDLYGYNGIISSQEQDGYIRFRAENLLLPKTSEIARFILTPAAAKNLVKLPVYILAANFRNEETSEKAYFALPLSPEGLRVFGSEIDDLLGYSNESTSVKTRLSGEFDRNTKELIVTINIETDDHKTKRISVPYQIKQAQPIQGVDMLLWPNFVSNQWKRYFFYSEMPSNVTTERCPFNAVPFIGMNKDGQFVPVISGNNLRPLHTEDLLVVADHRVANSNLKYEIYESKDPIAGVKLTCGKDNEGNIREGGVLLIRYSQHHVNETLPLNRLNDTVNFKPKGVSLGFDFGSTNTSIAYFDPNKEDSLNGEGLQFKNHRISLLGTDMREESKDGRPMRAPKLSPKDLFFFPAPLKPIASNALKSMLTIHDQKRLDEDRLTILRDKPIAGGIPCLSMNLPIYSIASDKITLDFGNRVEAQVVSNMKWHDSDLDKSYKTAYLKTLLLMVYVELFEKGLRPDKLNWSYPSAMEKFTIDHHYNPIWESLAGESPILDANLATCPLKIMRSTDQNDNGANFINDKFQFVGDSGQTQEAEPTNDFLGGGGAFDFAAFGGGNSAPSGNPFAKNTEPVQTANFAAPVSVSSKDRFKTPVAATQTEEVKPLDLTPDNPKKKLDFDPIKTDKPMSEACASANYTSQASGVSKNLVVCFDVGGSTTDISALYNLTPNQTTMIKQSSIRFAAQRISSATRLMHEDFGKVLTRVCNQYNIKLLGFNEGEDRYSADTAQYYYEQVVDVLQEAEQLRFFYSTIAADCPRLFAINMFVTGLIMFYAGQLSSTLIDAVDANITPGLQGPSGFEIAFEGKGARIFDWLSTINYNASVGYFKTMFIQGFGGMDASFIDLSKLNAQSSPEVKFEVSKGLAMQNGTLRVPKESFEVFGEDGYQGFGQDGRTHQYNYSTKLTPDWMEHIGGFIRQTNPMCPCFAKFCQIYATGVTQLIGIQLDVRQFQQGLSSMNIDQYIQQDLAPFRQAKERAQKSNKFDYVAPIIIIEGIKFYEKHLLKCFA